MAVEIGRTWRKNFNPKTAVVRCIISHGATETRRKRANEIVFTLLSQMSKSHLPSTKLVNLGLVQISKDNSSDCS